MANAAMAKMAMDAIGVRERCSIAIGLRVLPGCRSPAAATARNRAGLVPPQQLYCARTAPSQSEPWWSIRCRLEVNWFNPVDSKGFVMLLSFRVEPQWCVHVELSLCQW